MLVLLLVLGSVGMTLAACQTTTSGYTVTATPTSTPNAYHVEITPTPGSGPTATSTDAPIKIEATCTLVSIPTPTATSSTKVPRDQLIESLLEPFPRTVNTSASGLGYYNWYKKLWDNPDFWWWKHHNAFTVWDFLTLVLYEEINNVGNPKNTTMYEGFPFYKEAIVRVVYEDAKYWGYTGGTPEATMNWLAGYSQSGANYSIVGHGLCCDRIPELKDNPYGSAEEIINAIRFPERYGSPAWTTGLAANAPYGVGNKSKYEARRLNKAGELGMIAWRSGKDTGDEVIIPTGCGSKILDPDVGGYEWLGCGNGRWPWEDERKEYYKTHKN